MEILTFVKGQLICPISHNIIKNPVISQDGITYDTQSLIESNKQIKTIQDRTIQSLLETDKDIEFTTIESVIRCPITCLIFNDPVIAEDTYTYERTAICEWFTKNKTSPLTRNNISNKLIDNKLIKKISNKFFDLYPEYKHQSFEYNNVLDRFIVFTNGIKTIYNFNNIIKQTYMTYCIIIDRLFELNILNNVIFSSDQLKEGHILDIFLYVSVSTTDIEQKIKYVLSKIDIDKTYIGKDGFTVLQNAIIHDNFEYAILLIKHDTTNIFNYNKNILLFLIKHICIDKLQLNDFILDSEYRFLKYLLTIYYDYAQEEIIMAICKLLEYTKHIDIQRYKKHKTALKLLYDIDEYKNSILPKCIINYFLINKIIICMLKKINLCEAMSPDGSVYLIHCIISIGNIEVFEAAIAEIKKTQGIKNMLHINEHIPLIEYSFKNCSTYIVLNIINIFKKYCVKDDLNMLGVFVGELFKYAYEKKYNINILKELLKISDVNVLNGMYGMGNIFHCIVSTQTYLDTQDYIYIINYLLNIGVNVNCIDSYNKTPLMYIIDSTDYICDIPNYKLIEVFISTHKTRIHIDQLIKYSYCRNNYIYSKLISKYRK